MDKLKELIYVEAYRPCSFDDLIFNEKEKVLEYLKTPKAIPSFIFHSSSPGTGKTSCAKLIFNELKCDAKFINASKERGIDTIRDEVSLFSRAMSFDSSLKKGILFDEAEGMTSQAQESLKSLMEEYSSNIFYIFNTNDLSKIIEPIRSRCVIFNFNKPNKQAILNRLINVCELENIDFQESDCQKILDAFYPDIRSMIMSLQDKKLGGNINGKLNLFDEALTKLKTKDFNYFKEKVFSQELDLFKFNNYLFNYFFNDHKSIGLEKTGKILLLLADNEKSQNIGSNMEIVFTANLIQIMNTL